MTRESGKIRFFNVDKGFGFIIPQDGSKDVFVHISQVDGKKALRENQTVEYDLAQSKKGVCAENVKPC